MPTWNDADAQASQEEPSQLPRIIAPREEFLTDDELRTLVGDAAYLTLNGVRSRVSFSESFVGPLGGVVLQYLLDRKHAEKNRHV